MNLDDRELATVLAALRFWQRERNSRGEPERVIATDSHTFPELEAMEIDILCERLNFGDL